MANGDTIFSKDDLFLLLEAYRTQIDSNTALLNKQEKLIEQQNNILDKQKVVCDLIDKLLGKLDIDHNTIKDKLTNSNVDCIKEHSSIKNKIYLIYVGIAGAIISLITLLHASYQRTEILKGMRDLIIEIAKKLGVGLG